MKHKILKYLFTVFILTQTFYLNAFSIPHLSGRVNDYANIIGDKSYQIEQKLEALEKQTTAQVVVLTVPSMGNASSIEEYSIEVAEKWQLGQKDKDNGVLITVALTEHKMRIDVGYGLEGVLTDAISKIIIERKMVPKFKQNDYAGGIEDAVNDICSLLCNEELVVDEYKKLESSTKESGSTSIIILIIGFLILLFGNIPCSIISAIYVIIAINGFFHNPLLLILLIIICIGIQALRFAFYDYLEDMPFLGPLFRICHVVTNFIVSTAFSSSGSSGGSSYRGGSSGGGFSGGGGRFGGGGASGGW